MLSMPLPGALSSSLPKFLGMLLSKAIDSRSPESIKPIFQVISGLGYGHIDDLPLSLVTRFQEQLTEILAKHDTKDPLPGPLCLGVLAIFASIRNDEKDYTNVSNKMQVTDHEDVAQLERYAIARKFFTTKRAHKTLDVTIFKAIDVCSGSSMLSHDQGLEILEICISIIDAVSTHDKKAWVAKNPMRAEKFLEKIARPEIDRNLQCLVIILLHYC